jgi:hypothetical protein
MAMSEPRRLFLYDGQQLLGTIAAVCDHQRELGEFPYLAGSEGRLLCSGRPPSCDGPCVMRPGRQHTPQARARISAPTRAAMHNPDVRARISPAAKAGVALASGSAQDFLLQRSAWAAAHPAVGQKCVAELLPLLFEADCVRPMRSAEPI